MNRMKKILNQMTWESISEKRSLIFGFLTIMIFCYHFCEDALHLKGFPLILKPLGMYGNCAVDIFLLLSGLGLYYSFSKNSNILEFYKKRFVRVLVPYLMLALPYLIWKDFFVSFQPIEFFLDWFLITAFQPSNRQCWFVAAILIFYLLYPLVHKLINDKGRNALIVIGVVMMLTILLYYAADPVYQTVEVALTRFPVFIMGSYLGTLSRQGVPIGKRTMWHLFLILPIAGMIKVVLYVLSRKLGIELPYIDRFWLGYVGLAILFFATVFFNLVEGKKKLQGFFLFFGTISLEMYVAHVQVRRAFFHYVQSQSIGVYILGYALCIIPLGLLMAVAVSRLYRRLFDQKAAKERS